MKDFDPYRIDALVEADRKIPEGIKLRGGPRVVYDAAKSIYELGFSEEQTLSILEAICRKHIVLRQVPETIIVHIQDSPELNAAHAKLRAIQAILDGR